MGGHKKTALKNRAAKFRIDKRVEFLSSGKEIAGDSGTCLLGLRFGPPFMSWK